MTTQRRIAKTVAGYFEQLRASGEATPDDLSLLAEALLQVAEVQGGITHGDLGAYRDAIANLQGARQVYAELAEVSSDDVAARVQMALTHRREAAIHANKLGEHVEAIDDLEAIEPLLSQVPQGHARWLAARRIRGNALLDQGDIRHDLGDAGLAASSWNRGLSVLGALAEEFSDNHRVQRDHGHALRRVGVAQADADPQLGLETLRASRGTFEKIRDDRPNDAIAHRDLAWGWYYQGWAAMLIPHKDESIDAMRRGWDIVVLRCATNPTDVQARSGVTCGGSTWCHQSAKIECVALVTCLVRHDPGWATSPVALSRTCQTQMRVRQCSTPASTSPMTGLIARRSLEPRVEGCARC